ncbi:sorting nexin-2 [Desmophyllum pertusum]|uniref:Sorting nexin-2 n=1 Tax=Desmophyllum pertusum TaxID=174260 RepID=A0A9W9ZWT8_9CNID|nr:sorting nexin-2 [Desmophyllum pertusum]
MEDDREPAALFDEDVDTPEAKPDEETNGDLFIGETTEITLDDAGSKKDDTPVESDQGSADIERLEGGENEEKPESSAAASVDVTNLSKPSKDESEPAPKEKPEEKEVEEEEEDDTFDMNIKVSDPEKIGDGMSSYMVFKVTTMTSIPTYKNSEMFVKRRFSDFLGLHDRLNSKFLHLGRLVPPAPEKSVVGMTKVKLGKGEDNNPVDFINKRRAALERYLNRVSKHPILREDPDFRQFLEADVLPRAKDTAALSGGGLKRFVKSVGDTMFQLTTKMSESDQWFEEKQQQIETLDLQLKKLHQSIEVLALQRRDLSSSTAAFAKSTAMLSNAEEHATLSRALSQLAEVEEKIEQLHIQQADSDFYVVAELLKDYIGLIQSVKASFQERVRSYSNWQHAQQMLTKKREALVKLELASKNEKLPQAQEEVKEWEQKVEKGEEDFGKISKMIQKEMARFEKNRVKDFRESMIKYLEAMMDSQQQLIKYWEGFPTGGQSHCIDKLISISSSNQNKN